MNLYVCLRLCMRVCVLVCTCVCACMHERSNAHLHDVCLCICIHGCGCIFMSMRFDTSFCVQSFLHSANHVRVVFRTLRNFTPLRSLALHHLSCFPSRPDNTLRLLSQVLGEFTVEPTTLPCVFFRPLVHDMCILPPHPHHSLVICVRPPSWSREVCPWSLWCCLTVS